jgi:hypothetical protein
LEPIDIRTVNDQELDYRRMQILRSAVQWQFATGTRSIGVDTLV